MTEEEDLQELRKNAEEILGSEGRESDNFFVVEEALPDVGVMFTTEGMERRLIIRVKLWDPRKKEEIEQDLAMPFYFGSRLGAAMVSLFHDEMEMEMLTLQDAQEVSEDEPDEDTPGFRSGTYL